MFAENATAARQPATVLFRRGDSRGGFLVRFQVFLDGQKRARAASMLGAIQRRVGRANQLAALSTAELIGGCNTDADAVSDAAAGVLSRCFGQRTAQPGRDTEARLGVTRATPR